MTATKPDPTSLAGHLAQALMELSAAHALVPVDERRGGLLRAIAAAMEAVQSARGMSPDAEPITKGAGIPWDLPAELRHEAGSAAIALAAIRKARGG